MTTTPRQAVDRDDPLVTRLRDMEERLRVLERRSVQPVRVGKWSLTLNADGDLIALNRDTKTSTVVAS